ncbi:GAF domain-containing protein [Nostoc sp. FACHB-152]|uniref:GAF domain-containing protein n=1 Tax=unclassified Nostoc TaxID=2593658 RepID=UPI0016878811|nr:MULTISPECIES: GAF domain-containing protein [unclassified Nostoc]MBD2446239.1 GAF domain-containing protein [Nostoc sp. FACHB-152]MBD2469509.1 GAF domain-containing protein [Nostoc sp. FACHB-145]
MTDLALPVAIQSVFDQHSEPDAILSNLMPALGEVLQCDRCFLYSRNPETKFGRVSHCWRRNQDIPEIGDPDWKLEPAGLPDEDPMFAAALRTAPSIYVEDVETADPKVLNKEFERQNFGHRALIHAHLSQDGQLWGILQPCVFSEQRTWSERDRAIITQLESKLVPVLIDYVKKAPIPTISDVAAF